MDVSTINWLAVAAATLSGFILGGIWYSPLLFANSWMKDNDLNNDTLATGSKPKIFGFTAFFLLLMATNLALFLNDPNTNASWGASAGFLAGIWTFAAIAIHSLFELKPWRLILINGFYSMLSLTIMGLIIGAWR